MSNTEDITGLVKKKRGRKKKCDILAAAAAAEKVQTVVPEQEVKEDKPKSRRGRKTKAVVSAYEVDNGANTLSDDENIIVKLDTRGLNQDNMGFLDITEIQPNAYDAQNSFESTPQYLSRDMPSPHMSEEEEHHAPDIAELKVVDLLKDFQKKSDHCEWPQNTSIACYWCCHQFHTVPFGIPVKYHNGKFHVYGCFCSLECATAFNFSSQESSDEIWERFNLINLLSRKLSYKPLVKSAPSRLALKMFGGHLDIEAFREYFDSNKILSENFPPMMTLTQQIEEINECDINSEYRYIPIDHDRINKYKEKLTLKRTKPLQNYKHTLDHMMNLKIQND